MEIQEGRTFLQTCLKNKLTVCKKMLQEENGPIYIFTDSIKLVKILLKDLFEKYSPILIDCGYIETFYLFTKIKRIITSDSTLSVGGVLLNKKAKQIVIPNYLIDINTYKVIKHFSSKFSDKYNNIIKEDNQKYIMQKSDIFKLKKYIN